jgi:hypothetical protein
VDSAESDLLGRVYTAQNEFSLSVSTMNDPVLPSQRARNGHAVTARRVVGACAQAVSELDSSATVVSGGSCV